MAKGGGTQAAAAPEAGVDGYDAEVTIRWPVVKLNPKRPLQFARGGLGFRDRPMGFGADRRQTGSRSLGFRQVDGLGRTEVAGARVIRAEDMAPGKSHRVLSFKPASAEARAELAASGRSAASARAAMAVSQTPRTDEFLRKLHSDAFALYKSGQELYDQALELLRRGQTAEAQAKREEAVNHWWQAYTGFDKVITLDPEHEKAGTAKKNRAALEKKIQDAKAGFAQGLTAAGLAATSNAAKLQATVRREPGDTGPVRLGADRRAVEQAAAPSAAAPAWAQPRESGGGRSTYPGGATSAGTWRCPSCYQPVESTWVVCVSCGTNLRQYRAVYY